MEDNEESLALAEHQFDLLKEVVSRNPILIKDQQENCVMDGKNPMQISLILLDVFKNLLFDDLKNCRLVNSLWRSEATPIFKTKSRVYLAYSSRVLSENIARYKVEMKDVGHQNFVLEDYSSGVKSAYNIYMKDFFPEFGTQIQFLNFNFNITEVSDFETFKIHEIFKSVPNLKEFETEVNFSLNREVINGFTNLTSIIKPLENVRKLHLDVMKRDLYSYYLDDDEIIKENMLEVFSNFMIKLFPKLESLNIRLSPYTERILLKYANTAKECKISKVQIVNVSHAATIIISILNRWPTPLTQFHFVCYTEWRFDAVGFQNLLHKHSATLQDISLCLPPVKKKSEKIIEMPIFPNLIELYVENYSNKESCNIIFKFKSPLKEHFPMLKMENDKIDRMFKKLLTITSRRWLNDLLLQIKLNG